MTEMFWLVRDKMLENRSFVSGSYIDDRTNEGYSRASTKGGNNDG